MKDIVIYTDGSCDKNPGGNGGWACVILTDTGHISLSGYEEKTTNQRMELMAAIQGIEYIKEKTDIMLFSDSAYLVNCMNERWYKKWNKNGWKNSNNELVANKELWIRLMAAIERHNQVVFIKVKGHSDNALNNKCDELAKSAITFELSIRNP